MTGSIGQIKRYAMLIETEIVDKITRQVQRRNDHVLKHKIIRVPGCLRQHIHLHAPPGTLIFLQQAQTGLQFTVGRFERFAVTPVFQAQCRIIKHTQDRMFQHRKIINRLDQVVSSTEAKRLHRISRTTTARKQDHRCFRA